MKVVAGVGLASGLVAGHCPRPRPAAAIGHKHSLFLSRSKKHDLLGSGLISSPSVVYFSQDNGPVDTYLINVQIDAKY